MLSLRSSVFVALLTTLAALADGGAWAAKSPKVAKAKAGKTPAAKMLPAAELEALGTQLAAIDENAATGAAKKLGESGAANAVEPLMEVLAVGTSPPVAAEAIAALEKLNNPKALAILTLYSGNRNIPVRLAAVKALATIKDDRVTGILLERLGDSASEVRAASAEALAMRKEPRAQERLYLLVSRSDTGAAGPLGKLIVPEQIPRVAELFGRVESNVLALVFGEFLKRPEVPDRLRLDVVRTLARIPGQASTTALVEYLATVPANDGRPSKDEAQKVLDRGGRR